MTKMSLLGNNSRFDNKLVLIVTNKHVVKKKLYKVKTQNCPVHTGYVPNLSTSQLDYFWANFTHNQRREDIKKYIFV